MKRKGQGKKEYIVLKFSDYSNNWEVYSKPVTINQASWLINNRPHVSHLFKMELINKGLSQ